HRVRGSFLLHLKERQLHYPELSEALITSAAAARDALSRMASSPVTTRSFISTLPWTIVVLTALPWQEYTMFEAKLCRGVLHTARESTRMICAGSPTARIPFPNPSARAPADVAIPSASVAGRRVCE